MRHFSSYFRILVYFLLSIWLISACGEIEPSVTATYPVVDSPVPTSTLTLIPPSPTPVPLAAIVNGEGITLEEYTSEVRRFLSAQGEGSSLDSNEVGTHILDELISQTLLAQGAHDAGFQLDEDAYQNRFNEFILCWRRGIFQQMDN